MNRSEQKKRAILDAAKLEFEQYGFISSSMDQIAARAQTSKRTVYNHFKSKDLLFQTIVEEMFQLIFSASLQDFEKSTPLKEQLLQIAQQELKLFSSKDFMSFSKVVLAEAMRNPDFSKEAFSTYQSKETGIETWLKAAHQAKSLLIPDTKFASEQFIGMLKSFFFWPQIFGSPVALTLTQQNQILESTVEMFLSYYQKQN